MATSEQKLFRVVEAYPQARVRKILLLRAANKRRAGDDPHSQEILRTEYDIDEGGEARTESVEEVRSIENPSGKHYYRQVFTVEVLSDKPVDFDSLADLHEVITFGDCSGKVTLTRQEEVPAAEMIKLLEVQGSEADFLVAEEDFPAQVEEER